MPLAVSEITREVDKAFLLIGGVSLFLLLGITVAMVLFVTKFHRSRRKTVEQIKGNTLLEITWIVIPTLIVIWMFFVGYEGFALMRNAPANSMVVRVTGQRWSWSFEYPDRGLTSDKLFVPVDQPVKLLLTAPKGDVIHSFYIPDFRVKEDVLPEQETSMWFQAEREGIYHIFCAEYCGKGHSEMRSELIVLSKEEYREWVNGRLAQRNKPLELPGVLSPDHPMFDKLGADRLYRSYCASCHGEKGDGSGLPDARAFFLTEGWKRGRKLTDIYRTLSEGIKDTQMRGFPQLSRWERFALAHRVQAFFKTPAPKDSAEDVEKLVKEYKLDQQLAPQKSIPIEDAMKALIEETGPGTRESPQEGHGDG